MVCAGHNGNSGFSSGPTTARFSTGALVSFSSPAAAEHSEDGSFSVLVLGGSSLFEDDDYNDSTFAAERICFSDSTDGAVISGRGRVRLTSASIVMDAAAWRSASSMRANSP